MVAKLKILKSVELSNPILIAGFPGAGNVAKLAVDNIIFSTKAQLFAKIYNYGAPAKVFIFEDGTCEPLSFSIYFARGDRDLVIATGYAQPESPEDQYDISEKILELGKSMGCKRIYSFGAYIVDREVEEPRVFGTATSTELVSMLKNNGVITMNAGFITGMNGVIFALAPILNMEGICLLGESLGYYADGKAAKRVLEVFSKLTDISIDYSLLDKVIAEVSRSLERLRKEEERMREYKKPSKLGYIS